MPKVSDISGLEEMLRQLEDVPHLILSVKIAGDLDFHLAGFFRFQRDLAHKGILVHAILHEDLEKAFPALAPLGPLLMDLFRDLAGAVSLLLAKPAKPLLGGLPADGRRLLMLHGRLTIIARRPKVPGLVLHHGRLVLL